MANAAMILVGDPVDNRVFAIERQHAPDSVLELSITSEREGKPNEEQCIGQHHRLESGQ